MAKRNKYAEMFTLRKDGRYVASVTGPDGKRKYIYDKDPEALFYKVQSANEPKEILFSDIAEAWRDAVCEKIEDGTKSTYWPAYKRAVDRLGDVPAKDVLSSDIDKHLSYMAMQGFAKSTIKSQRTVYSRIFKLAMSNPKFEKEVRVNPVKPVEIPKDAKKAVKRTAPEDEIVLAIRKSAETAYWGLFPMFLICTGFRRGEALAVKWQDIDFENKLIFCHVQVTTRGGWSREKDTKTEKGVRSVPLLPALEKCLKRPPDAKNTDYVFYGTDPSKPLCESTYNRRWMHYCKDMGLVTVEQEERISKQGKKYIHSKYDSTITAHVLRHGYATMLYEAEIDELEACQYMGHSDIRITREVYTDIRMRKQAKDASKLIRYSKELFEE